MIFNYAYVIEHGLYELAALVGAMKRDEVTIHYELLSELSPEEMLSYGEI